MPRLLLALSLILALIACDTGSTSKVELTGDHLAVMALTLADFGPEYQAFRPDEDSGEKTREEIVEGAADPGDEAADVARFGHLIRYVRSYTSNVSIIRGAGAPYLGNSVTLYADEKGAAGDLDDQLADLQRNISGTTGLGSLQSFQMFEAGVGEKSYGVTARLLTPGNAFGLPGTVTLTITAVAFQRDRLVAEVMFMRFDANDVQAESVELARKLDRRMKTVLSGGLPDTGVASDPVGSDPAPPQSP